MSITLSINGYPVEVSEGATVLDAINQSGTYISQPVSYTHLTLPTKRIV